MTLDSLVEIGTRDFWFKLVEFLQQNWALVDHTSGCVPVWFVNDTSGFFDELIFATDADAVAALQRNGFRRYSDDPKARDFIAVPQPPFHRREHPSDLVYSSGRFWKLKK